MRIETSLLLALATFALPACAASDPCDAGASGGATPCLTEGGETAPAPPDEDPCPPCGRG